MNPALVLFAIEAGVKLGRKINDVLVDQTMERPLLLPLGDRFGSIPEAEAGDFFFRPENRHLIEQGGPFFGYTPAQRLQAYRSLKLVDDRVGSEVAQAADVQAAVLRLEEFAQFKAGFGARHPVQRLLGTLVEIGIDYVVAHPEAMGRASDTRRILHSFVSSLDETDFAEGTRTQIVGDLLAGALGTLAGNTALISDDRRVQALVGGVTQSLLQDVNRLTSVAGQIGREALLRRIGTSLLRGGANAFSTNPDLFLPGDGSTKQVVKLALDGFLAGIRDQEDWFTNEALELLFRSSLQAAAESPELFSGTPFLQQLIGRTLETLATPNGRALFSEATAAAILREAIEVTRQNLPALMPADRAGRVLLVEALGAVAEGMSVTLAGPGRIQDLFTRQQLVELASIGFSAVARHPETLLGDSAAEPGRVVLAQVIASVAHALGDNPARLVSGEGFIELVRMALQVVVRNVDQLIDLKSASPETNLLHRIVSEFVEGVRAGGDPRRMVTREVFVELLRRILPLASANVEALLDGAAPVLATVSSALALAQGGLKTRIDGGNLPGLVEQLLREVLWGKLDPAKAAAFKLAARRILKTL